PAWLAIHRSDVGESRKCIVDVLVGVRRDDRRAQECTPGRYRWCDGAVDVDATIEQFAPEVNGGGVIPDVDRDDRAVSVTPDREAELTQTVSKSLAVRGELVSPPILGARDLRSLEPGSECGGHAGCGEQEWSRRDAD